ncbi:hypothetical protein JZY91_09730 [Corynebacterium sp. CNCTC7651]|uniref:hypothetical protein n=1 Tax=Corynebacterium sp. CNCTC7651 TaxID=2815361 RepID=UPI001F2D0C51|nr:hypothetical protein [Corynebacterium sp. CNCTC7651]UIZ91948.1 hypothetical protein JZY91_09730 [Corynebacterium sp. CNCTC7651]
MKKITRAAVASAMAVTLVVPSVAPASAETTKVNATVDAAGNAKVDVNATETAALPENCKNALLGFGIPLLSLIPLGLLAQVALGGASNVTNVIDQQIRDFNTEIQRQAGILNPELAVQVEAIDKYLSAFGYSVGSVIVGLTAMTGGIAASAVILNSCLADEGGALVATVTGHESPLAGQTSSIGGYTISVN